MTHTCSHTFFINWRERDLFFFFNTQSSWRQALSSRTAERGKKQAAPQADKKISACCVQSINLKAQLVNETAYCPGSRQEKLCGCYPLAFPASAVLKASLTWKRGNPGSGHRPVGLCDLLFCTWFLWLNTGTYMLASHCKLNWEQMNSFILDVSSTTTKTHPEIASLSPLGWSGLFGSLLSWEGVNSERLIRAQPLLQAFKARSVFVSYVSLPLYK